MTHKLRSICATLFFLLLAVQARAVLTDYSFTQTTDNLTDMTGAITGLAGGNDDVTGGSFPIGFTFNFDGTDYTTFTVSSNGWMKLGAHTTNSDLGNGFDAGALYPILAGFWDDLRTNNNGGYIRYKTDGPIGFQVLTVEWNATYWSDPTSGPWIWQVRLYETSGIIEFVYGSMIPNFGTTATIGIGVSSSNYLSVTPGTATTSGTVSSTVSNNNINLNVTPIPDNTVYRFQRLLDDVVCDSVWFNSANEVNGFSKDVPVTVNARVSNLGSIPKTNIPIRFNVYYNGDQLVYSSEAGLVSPGNRFGTANYAFNAIPGSVNSRAGLYEVHVYTQSVVDENRRNDTCRIPYFILGVNDITPLSILSPFQFTPPLFSQYPVGVGVPIEARFLNVGVRDQTNVDVGYTITNATGAVVFSANAIIPGTFRSTSFRDVILPSWTPEQPGSYCIKIFSNLVNDEDRTNDAIPRGEATFCFVTNYEISLRAVGGGITEQLRNYPIGRPIYMESIFENSGLNDATNSMATMSVFDPRGNRVYFETVSVLDIPATGGRVAQQFPNFAPPVTSGSGQYCVGVKISHPGDPLRTDDSTTFCFNVLAPLVGDITVGFAERFQTIQEARDSLVYLGVAGPVNFLLTDSEYSVEPPKFDDESAPALDFRGSIIGAGENAPITWRAHPNKSQVNIRLLSPSGIGIWFGQQGKENPNGYMIFDGGVEKKLHFQLENTRNAHDLAIPFMFGRGSSNYTVKNCIIEPLTDGKMCTKTIVLPTYDPGFNRFSYRADIDQTVSAGIMLRNTMPFNPITLSNDENADTLFNQNNVFESNEISGFAYGILSVGAGPMFRGQTARFEVVNNRSNVYRKNMISNVGRGGIVVTNESNSLIEQNWIRGVANQCGTNTGNHAAGIWLTAGGNASGNNGFSNDIDIVGNRVSDITTDAGAAVAIWVENNRNVLVTPANVVQEFPAVSNMKVRNNMTWDYAGEETSVGIGFSTGSQAGSDYTPRGNAVHNNTIFNQNNNTAEEYGIGVEHSQASVKNNLIAVTNRNAVGLGYRVRSEQNAPGTVSVESDYNLIWAPNGAVGGIQHVSPQGFDLPSPPVAVDLAQWQYLTGLDLNSVVGNVIPEFKSLTPGSEDLHLNPQLTRSIAGNRGTRLTDVPTDIDGEPRTQAVNIGRYDIGADEFWGVVHNIDIVADNVLPQYGYRATAGLFSDAEYMMTGPNVPLTARVRNVGGNPVASTAVTLDVEYWNGSTWINAMSATRQTSVDISEASDVAFGDFTPQTMLQLGLNDPKFGTMRPNVTPIYRFVVQTGNDGDLTNNRFEKTVRFFVLRSKTESIISVENYAPAGTALPADPIALGNRLNSDSLLAAFSQIQWARTGANVGAATFDYDLFERDRWPQYALNFAPWQLTIWAQGEETTGLTPEERLAIKAQQNAWNQWRPAGLLLMGQEIARIHDVPLNATNGHVADRDFVRNYLRAEYRGATNPAAYNNLRIQGLRITNGRFEMVNPTGVTGDADPRPSVLRATSGDGVAQGTHYFVDHNSTSTTGDSVGGMTVAALTRAAVFYAIDIRHFGRFAPEANRSGVQRVVLGALDFLDQYGIVLPVDLVSFDAEQTGRETVTLRWKTAAEKDLIGLELDRAEVLKTEAGERLSNYQTVAKRTPEGSPTTVTTYREIDQNVRTGREYQYRLISVEKDGSRHEMATVRVEVIGSGKGFYSLEVHPNPVVNVGEITWTAPRGETAEMVIVDAAGSIVQSTSIISEGEGSMQIDVRDFASGQYIVRLVTSRGQVITRTLQVRK